MKPNGFSSTDLNVLQDQLAAWRRSQTGRARLPGTLWSAAATLARSEGVSWVARALHLDYGRLQRRCRRNGTIPAATAPVPAFVEVELQPPRPQTARTCRMELWGANGQRLALELDADPSMLVRVVACFLGRQP